MIAKEPFNKDFSFLSPKSLNLKSYMHVVVCECDDFLVACYVLTKGPKANQNPSLTCCSNLWGKANQIIFHTFREKSQGLHTRLATVNHRHPFSDFPFYHCNHYIIIIAWGWSLWSLNLFPGVTVIVAIIWICSTLHSFYFRELILSSLPN